VRLAPIRGGVMFYNETYYPIDQAFECDSTFFEVFDAELLIGDKKTILNAPGSMVVTESFASKVFGSANPIGEVISIPSGQFYGEKIDFTIKGVMKDFPQNSHFHPELITTPAKGSNWLVGLRLFAFARKCRSAKNHQCLSRIFGKINQSTH
jgi:putative ABC transport system permease protein